MADVIEIELTEVVEEVAVEIAEGGGGGGSSTFAGLTDKATADLPVINTPLASALAGKETGGAAATAQAYSIQRANHTGTQAQSTIINLVSDLAAKASLAGNNTFTGQQAFTEATTWSYTSAAASAHRIALGAGTSGSELFGAASAAAARTTLTGEILKYTASTGTTQTNPTAYVDDDALTGINLTAGMWEFDFYFSFDSGTCGVTPQFVFGTPGSVGLATDSRIVGPYYRGGNAIAGLAYRTATGLIPLIASPAAAQTDFQYVGSFALPITGATTFKMQFAVASSVAGQTINRRANAYLRARKIN
jgi:hypothetical protein